jgi:acyl-CoA synthetase (AMP-forming)/AMP-acid ligase II
MTTRFQDSLFSADRTCNRDGITDGSLHCSYEELPSLFAEMDERFAALGVTGQQTVAFACPNSVAGAVTLLYLLARGYSFMLLPTAQGASGKQQGAAQPALPHFCQHYLTIAPGSLQPGDGAKQPHGEQHGPRATVGYRPTGVEAQSLCATRTLPPGRLYVRTSGSLGSSKIVVHQHDRLLENARNCVKRYQIESSDRLFLPVPIFHMYGMGAAFLSAVLAGAAIQIVDKANIFKIVTYEKQFRPTLTFLTPDLCEMMVRWKQKSNTYRVMVTSGQRIQDSLFDECNEKFGNCLVNQYGSTEMGAIAACSWQDPLDLRRATIGAPMEGVELRLAQWRNAPATQADASGGDASGAEPRPLGGQARDTALRGLNEPHAHEPGIDESGVDESGIDESGELLCRHPYGYLGYVDEQGDWLRQSDDEDAGSWYHTGDLARRAPSAYFQIVGRCQDSFNRRGYLVNLSEVARALERVAGVQSAVVFYVESPDSPQTGQLIACCVASVDGAQIREASFAYLPGYARPDQVLVEESFPLLPSGKIDRQALQSRLETRFAGSSSLR